MYRGTPSAGQQWQQACDFYEEDLKSGFVRLLMELMGASFHDEELRREFVPRLPRWHRLVEAAVTSSWPSPKLELPVSAQAIAAWIVWYWTGMEASMMLGIAENEGHQREALEAVATLLRRSRSAPRSRRDGGVVMRAADAAAARAARSRPGRCRAPGTLPEPYPFESIAPLREGFVERDGVRSWYAQFGETGPWLVFAPVFQIANATCCAASCPGWRSTFASSSMTCAATAGPTGRPRPSSTRSTTTTPTSSPCSTASRSIARRSSASRRRR